MSTLVSIPKLDHKVVLSLGGLAIIAYLIVTRDAKKAVESVGDAIKKISDGIVFSKGDLGPEVRLTNGAKLSEAEHIRLGHMERTAGGGTRITAKGEAYIRSQQQMVPQVTGKTDMLQRQG